MECREADPCASYFSRIKVLRVSCNRGQIMSLSGNFVIVSDSGRKLEDSFAAKYVKPPHQLICE